MAAVAKVSFVGDASSLKAAVAQSNAQLRELNNQAKASGQALASIDDAFGALAKGAAAVGGFAAVSAGLMSVVNAASAVQQSVGSVEAVFKGQAGEMLAAAKAAESLGLSQSEYSQTAAILGAQLKNLGVSQDQVAGKTQEMIRHAADMAAVFGTTVPEATDALGAALRGEYEQIEKYGISIKESAVQAEIAATGVGKAQAVVNLVMRQSQDVVGAAAKEADTWAVSSQRMAAAAENAKAKIGEGLLPIMSTIATAASTFASAASAIPAPIYTTVAAIGLLVVGKKALTAAIAKANVSLASYAAAQQIASVKSAQAGAAAAAAGGGFYALGAAAGSAAASTSLLGTAAGGAAGKVGLMAKSAGVLAVAYAGWDFAAGKANDSLRKQVMSADEMARSMASGGKSIRDMNIDLSEWAGATPLIDDQIEGWKALEHVFNQTGWEKVKNGFGEIFSLFKGEGTVERTAAVEWLTNMQAGIAKMAETDVSGARARYLELIGAMRDAGASGDDIAAVQEALADSFDTSTSSMGEQMASLQDLAKEYKNSQGALEEYELALRAQTDPFFAAQKATADLIVSMQELTAQGGLAADAIDANTGKFNLYTESGRAAEAALMTMGVQLQELAIATQQNNGSWEEFRVKQDAARQSVVDMLAPLLGNRDAAEKLAQAYLLTEGDYRAVFSSNAETERDKADELRRKLDEIERKRIAYIEVMYRFANQPGDIWNPSLGAWVPGGAVQQSAPPSAPSLSPFGGTTTSSMSSGVTSTGRTNLGRIMPEPVRPQVTVIVDPASGRARPLEDAWSPNLVGVG